MRNIWQQNIELLKTSINYSEPGDKNSTKTLYLHNILIKSNCGQQDLLHKKNILSNSAWSDLKLHPHVKIAVE